MMQYGAVAIVALAGLFLFTPIAETQSVEKGMELHQKAKEIHKTAQSNEDRKKAEALYKEALGIFRSRDFRKGIGDVSNDLGNLYRNGRDYALAASMFKEALAIRRELNDRRGEMTTLNNLGKSYFGLLEYSTAASYFEKSLTIARKPADLSVKADILWRLGYLYWARNINSKALVYYKELPAIYRELKDRRRERLALTILGMVHEYLGWNAEAISSYEESLAIARELEDRGGEASELGYLGRVHARVGNTDKALDLLHLAMEIDTKSNYVDTWTNGLIAEAYLNRGDLGQAVPYLRKADSAVAWGYYYLLSSQPAAALSCYHRLRKRTENKLRTDDIFAAFTGLGSSHERLKQYGKAAEFFNRAVSEVEFGRSILSQPDREKFFNVRIGGFCRTAPYEGLSRVRLKVRQPLEALKSVEFVKGRFFLESAARLFHSDGRDAPESIRKRDSKLVERLSDLRIRLFDEMDEATREDLNNQIEELNHQLAEHKKELRMKYPAFAAISHPEPLSLTETGLRPEEWVITYDVTDSGLLVFLIKGKTIVRSAFKAVSRKDVNALVERFLAPLRFKPTDDIGKKLACFDFEVGKELTDLLLGDFLEDIPSGTPLIVMPDESLGRLPFEMLVLNEGGEIKTDKDIPYVVGARFFGDRNPLSYEYSLTVLTMRRILDEASSKGDRTLVVADPVFSRDDPRFAEPDPSGSRRLPDEVVTDRLMGGDTEYGLVFPRLPLTGNLAKSVEALDPEHTDVMTGSDASEARLLEKNLDMYGVIVLATHGYYGGDISGKNEPVLVLTLVDCEEGTDGFLATSDVEKLKLNADLVVLEASQSGEGPLVLGEGIMSMGRAFHCAGANSVLMSLWSVSEEASVQLVESFFKHLNDGKSKLDALRLARTEIRESGYDHPFFWAPFILVGEVGAPSEQIGTIQ